MIDLHCHLIPGFDDGARDLDQAVEMARISFKEGVSRIFCTPHISEEKFPRKEELDGALVNLRDALGEAGVDVEVLAGAELMVAPDLSSFLEENLYLTYGKKGRFVLVELPLVDYPLYVERAFFDLLVSGFQPILAHPERNARLQREWDLLLALHEMGILFQVNSGSILGHYGHPAQRVAWSLVEKGLATLIASDGHNLNSRPPLLKEAVKEVGWDSPTWGLPPDFP